MQRGVVAIPKSVRKERMAERANQYEQYTRENLGVNKPGSTETLCFVSKVAISLVPRRLASCCTLDEKKD